MENITLLNIPAESIHCIFDHCDALSILSFRFVCKQLGAAVSTYNRLQIVVNSNHYSYLKRILRIIRPENIISLIFSDMRAFRMLISEFVLQFDMERFNRLHFVSLHQVNDMQLEYVLKQMTTHQGRIQKIFYGGAVQRANFFKGGAEGQKSFFAGRK